LGTRTVVFATRDVKRADLQYGSKGSTVAQVLAGPAVACDIFRAAPVRGIFDQNGRKLLPAQNWASLTALAIELADRKRLEDKAIYQALCSRVFA
jgi:hypothetical protein